MIFGSVIWLGKKVLADTKARMERGLDKAAIMVVNEVVNSFGNPPREPDKSGGFKMNSSKKWKRKFHSAPGDPPFVQTGHLRRSITFDRPAPLQRRVGSTLRPEGGSDHSYAYYLEVGTGNMAARPYLRPAVHRLSGTITRMVTSG